MSKISGPTIYQKGRRFAEKDQKEPKRTKKNRKEPKRNRKEPKTTEREYVEHRKGTKMGLLFVASFGFCFV